MRKSQSGRRSLEMGRITALSKPTVCVVVRWTLWPPSLRQMASAFSTSFLGNPCWVRKVRGEVQLSRSTSLLRAGRSAEAHKIPQVKGKNKGTPFFSGQQGVLSVGVCMLRCKMLRRHAGIQIHCGKPRSGTEQVSL